MFDYLLPFCIFKILMNTLIYKNENINYILGLGFYGVIQM